MGARSEADQSNVLMPSGGVRVDGLSKVVAQLKAFGLEIDDLKTAFAALAAEGAAAVARHVPRRSGRLSSSVRGNRAQSKAVVRAGGAAVPYAGPINYGWRARHIEPANYMQKGDAELQPTAVKRLEAEIEAQITRKGLR